jgi:hypothetical protein
LIINNLKLKTMKTKLLKNLALAFTAFAYLSLSSLDVSAQSTISFGTGTPVSGSAGESITAALLYKLDVGTDSSNPGGTISLQLSLADPAVLDVWGNPIETEMPGRVNVINVPTAASESSYPLAIVLGNSTTIPSANLTGGKYYVLRVSIFEHNMGNAWDWKDSKSIPFTLDAPIAVSYSNTFSNSTIQSVAEDASVTETVQYTTPAISKIFFKLQRITGYPGTWEETDIPGTTVTFENLAATGVGLTATQTATIAIPAATLANYPLGANQSYMILSVLTDMSGNNWTDSRKTVAISASLGTDKFNKQGSKLIFQNPVKETLIINNEVAFKSLSIYDWSGKIILKANKEKTSNGIDVSSLGKGVYIIATDNNQKTKFIKE